MAGVESRAKVHALIESGNIFTALAEARSNPHPWYRCQSLSAVASEITNESRAESVLQEAMRAAREQQEPNRVVSVASWPISVYSRRGSRGIAVLVTELLQIISTEPNPIRRADALYLLLGAVLSDQALRDRVLPALLESCSAAHGWKSRRILQFTALAVARDSVETARDIIHRIPESRESRRAKRMLEESFGTAGS
jgi:hypothetical protein